MCKGNKIVSAWLQLILLLLTLFPRELVHELFECKDTHHCTEENLAADKIISIEHHHCQLMHLEAPLPYTAAQETVLSSCDFVIAGYKTYSSIVTDETVTVGSSRAPPVNC